MFFFARVFVKGKEFSEHTKRAYRANAKTLLDYLAENKLSFSDIGYPEVN
ncbi:hypothetical protein ABID52_000634 [Fictibacillus halophilus]|uniref:Uncharacterized protein n=2 Tax=Fictibacillus halophilus TaxID=1610490 RepID=A0ABV2LHU6_9BACL|nr:hypothetical protein [Fictibacillus halophilus]